MAYLVIPVGAKLPTGFKTNIKKLLSNFRKSVPVKKREREQESKTEKE